MQEIVNKYSKVKKQYKTFKTRCYQIEIQKPETAVVLNGTALHNSVTEKKFYSFINK